MPEPQNWRDRVVGALGAVLAVAVVIGVVVGAVAYGAVRLAGLGSDDDSASDAAQAPASRSASRSASPTPSAGPSHAASPSQRAASPSPSKTHEPKPKKKRAHHARKKKPQGLTLHASPQRVGHMGRVDLSGRYPGHGGATLVVQRREGGSWDRFPVSATVHSGSFHTWVASGRSGPNRFRMLDPATGATSAPVTVTVG
jgi:hypothetical protein